MRLVTTWEDKKLSHYNCLVLLTWIGFFISISCMQLVIDFENCVGGVVVGGGGGGGVDG